MLYEVDWAEDGTYRPGEFNSPENFQRLLGEQQGV